MDITPSTYTVSLHYDRRLYKQDIDGSVAHARMLGRQRIISDADLYGYESQVLTLRRRFLVPKRKA